MAQQKKHYSGDFAAMERKLDRVRERLGVPEEGCRYDWVSTRELQAAIKERDEARKQATEAEAGKKIAEASAAKMVEDMARAAEQGIVSFDQLVTGIPALPAAPELEPCFVALGFSERPTERDTVEAQYKRMARVMHPDAPGGSNEAFQRLRENYTRCLELVGER